MSEEGKQPEDPAAGGNPNAVAEEELRAAEEELAAARAAVAAAEERVAQARYAAAYPPPTGPAVGSPQPNPQPAPDAQPASAAQPANAQATGPQLDGSQQGSPQQYRPPVQPHYAAQAPSRDHVAAGLLAIFLGGFGVHKFYLGYSTQGFITLAVFLLGGLLSFGIVSSIMWIIAIVEGIIYLSKSQSEFERIYVYGKREWF